MLDGTESAAEGCNASRRTGKFLGYWQAASMSSKFGAAPGRPARSPAGQRKTGSSTLQVADRQSLDNGGHSSTDTILHYLSADSKAVHQPVTARRHPSHGRVS